MLNQYTRHRLHGYDNARRTVRSETHCDFQLTEDRKCGYMIRTKWSTVTKIRA